MSLVPKTCPGCTAISCEVCNPPLGSFRLPAITTTGATMSESIELKPCPFCGEEPSLYNSERDSEPWYVECNPAGDKCNIAFTCAATKEEALNKWNTRAESPNIYDEIAEIAGDLLTATQAGNGQAHRGHEIGY